MNKIKNWYSELNRSQVKTFWTLITCLLVEAGLVVWNLVNVSLWWAHAWVLPLAGFVIILVMFIKMLRRWAEWKRIRESDRAWENMFRREDFE